MTTIAPYGSWRSPISARDLAAGGHPISGAAWVGDDIWWLEARPSEAGRYAVRTYHDGEPVDILPAPWNARTRVHEYGGGAWTVTDDRALGVRRVQQTSACTDWMPAAARPMPLTPADAGFRFAELSVRGEEIIAVRETHAGGARPADIVAVPLDGSAADDAGADPLHRLRVPLSGVSAVLTRWHETRLGRLGASADAVGRHRTARRRAARRRRRQLADARRLATESVLQPEWTDDASLTAISDRSGWWNLVRIALDGAITPLHPEEAEYGGPLWTLGTRWYDVLDDGRLLAVRSFGADSLVTLDPPSGKAEPLATPVTTIALGPRSGDRVLLTGGSSTLATGLRVLNLTAGTLERCAAGRRRATGCRLPAARRGEDLRRPRLEPTRGARLRLPATQPRLHGAGRRTAALHRLRARRSDVAGVRGGRTPRSPTSPAAASA